METTKYTTHSNFSQNLAISILWAIWLTLTIIAKPSNTSLIVLPFIGLVYSLIIVIKCRLAWHSFMEVSDEGVKMKGCAQRISDNKKEKVDDLFIPWGDIEEIQGWNVYPILVLKTGEIIKPTQYIDIKGRTLQQNFEQYKSIQRQKELEPKNEPEQLKDDIISVLSATDDDKL